MAKSLTPIVALMLAVGGCSRGGAAPSPSPSPAPSGAASLTVAPASPEPVKPLPSPLPQVIATVNGEPIPLLHAKLMADNALQGRPPSPDLLARAYRNAMDQLVTREVVFQEAMARKLSADPKTLERDYDQAHAPYKDEAAWIAYLAKQGLDPQSFRKELRVRGTINALLKQVAEEVKGPVSEEEAKKYYEANPALFKTGARVRASHFLVMVPQGASPEVKNAARAKAEAALKRVKGGEDFAVVAKATSDDPGSAQNGGELPPFGKGAMVPPFEAAAFALPAGGISELVETQFGFHVIKVHEKLPEETAAFDTVKARLQDFILGTKRQEAVTLFVNELRKKAKVETYL